ncbi:diaminopimelate epimerase [Bifidobacterium leontopitheci]|uniref:Diaminopimelate epimerase n=1 Tax=Bifidobacterium leontopitheci TaxID=2650774 RepID=A0A6I1GH13_9BIFI|nr:diaminopimelate epimerase [Bifidobacterium leontopitheci]KAB7790002.1 diaminopimelate epimerase [Bifidobacterium leontopitheci]
MSIPNTMVKAHATGNDFIVYFDPDGLYEPTADEVSGLCDRHFGIGADGLLRLTRPQYVSDLTEEQRDACREGGAEWFMDYRNADGSLAEMCGNGTRAITLFARDVAHIDVVHAAPGGDGGAFALGTRAGVKTLRSLGDVEPYGRDVFRVEMGEWKRGDLDAFEVTIPGTPGSARGTFVDMGNPHVVAVIEDAMSTLPRVEDLDLAVKPVVSPVLESDQNVEFVRIDDIDEAAGLGEATMRVNERGCGETLSCGTGLCATGVTLRAKTGIDHWDITVRGGTLRVDVDDESVSLTGSATLVATVELR